MMKPPLNQDPDLIAATRDEAAADERAAILHIIERYMRQLSHGHGANGGQLLQLITDEIRQRGPSTPSSSGHS